MAHDGYGVLAVRRHGDFEQIGGAIGSGSQVGDHLFVRVDFLWRAQGEVSLPDVVDARRLPQDLENRGRTALAGTVVHNRHARLNRPDELRRIRPVQTVMRGLEEIHGADQIGRTYELFLVVPGNIAHIEELEFSELEQEADALVVVGIGFGRRLLFPVLAERGIRSATFQSAGNPLAGGHDDLNLDALERDPIAGLEDRAFSLGQLDVGLISLSLIHISEPTRLGMISYAV